MSVHKSLMKIARTLGYDVGTKGICNGYAALVTKAICLDDINSFNERMKKITQYFDHPQQLKIEIDKTREKIKHGDRITHKERLLLDIQAFFEEIYIYQALYQHAELFRKIIIQPNQSEILFDSLQTPAEKEEKKGVKHVFTRVNQYNEASLIDFLGELQSKLKDKPGSAIRFTANCHAITVRIKEDGLFQVIDINHPEDFAKRYTARELAKKLDKKYLFNNLNLTPELILNLDPSQWYRFARDTMSPKPLLLSTKIYTAQSQDLDLIDGFVCNDEIPVSKMARNADGSSLFTYAVVYNDLDTMKHISNLKQLNRDEIDNALATAAAMGNKEMVNYISSQVDLPDLPSPEHVISKCSLHIIMGEFEKAKEILNGTTKEMKHWNKIGTDLFLALGFNYLGDFNNRKAIANQLLSNGVDINAVNNDGSTPLHHSVFCGEDTIFVEYLLREGANPFLKNKEHLSPCDEAARHGKNELVQMFLNNCQLSFEELNQDTQLKKNIEKCSPETQILYLKTLLLAYKSTREKQAEYVDTFHLGYSKNEKLEAAKHFLEQIEAAKKLDSKQHPALINGRLSDFYKMYQHLSNLTKVKFSTASMMEQFGNRCSSLQEEEKEEHIEIDPLESEAYNQIEQEEDDSEHRTNIRL